MFESICVAGAKVGSICSVRVGAGHYRSNTCLLSLLPIFGVTSRIFFRTIVGSNSGLVTRQSLGVYPNGISGLAFSILSIRR